MITQGIGNAAAYLSAVRHSVDRQPTLPNGRVFDPTTTEITADNIRNLFRHLHVDETGQTDRLFESLAAYLERRDDPTTAGRNRVDA